MLKQDSNNIFPKSFYSCIIFSKKGRKNSKSFFFHLGGIVCIYYQITQYRHEHKKNQ